MKSYLYTCFSHFQLVYFIYSRIIYEERPLALGHTAVKETDHVPSLWSLPPGGGDGQ